eukprot:comp17575_c1_seq1/m.17197 comp17575_c1_seq1/g.17197  ORF comp17575_c1_seq1/g.17197 comp17575_c1_seq1/m.17197 type:complete len:100 (+) comp17575_c1_seq1:715-1014(+)
MTFKVSRPSSNQLLVVMKRLSGMRLLEMALQPTRVLVPLPAPKHVTAERFLGFDITGVAVQGVILDTVGIFVPFSTSGHRAHVGAILPSVTAAAGEGSR